MFNSAYNQHSSDRGYSTSNNNPRAVLGSGNTYWSNTNRNDQSSAVGTHTQRNDLNGVGSSMGGGGGGRSGKTMTWASVASQPTVKPVKAHSLRSKMANSSNAGSSISSFSSSGGKSLPPPIVTPPVSSVPPPVAQHPLTQPPALKPRDLSSNEVSSFFSPASSIAAPPSIPHPLLGSQNPRMVQNSLRSTSDRPPIQQIRNDRGDSGYNRPAENGRGGTSFPGQPTVSSWQQPHYRNFAANENPHPLESPPQRYPDKDMQRNGNGFNQQNISRTVVSSKLSSSSSPSSSSATSSSIRSATSSLTSDRTDRESSESSSVTGSDSVTKSLTALKLEPVVKVDKIDEILHQFNPEKFDLNPINARFFVIKSYSEDDIHRSIKYSIWCSTDHGNKRLDIAYKAQQAANAGPVYLFYSVNGSGHFCGMAQMVSSVDYNSTVSVWAQDKWKGQFKVKWIYVKDVPNSQMRHIRLENNENKPVTNSRDTQEVPPEKGKQVLQIIHSYSHTTSIFDDFLHYEKRQEEESVQRKDEVIVPPSGHSAHNREREARQNNGVPPRDNYGEDRRGQFHNNNSRGGGSSSGYDRSSLEQNRPRECFRGGHQQGHNNGDQNRGDNSYYRGHPRGGGGGNNQQPREGGIGGYQNRGEYQPRENNREYNQQRDERPTPQNHSMRQREGNINRRQLDPW